MGFQENVEDWILSIALKKGLKSLVKLILSFLTSVAVVQTLTKFGISFQVDQTALTAGLTALFNSGFEILRNYLKVKLGVKNLG